MAAGNTRIIRFVLLALICVAFLWFISASSIPEGSVPGGSDFAKWKARKDKHQEAGGVSTENTQAESKQADEKPLAGDSAVKALSTSAAGDKQSLDNADAPTSAATAVSASTDVAKSSSVSSSTESPKAPEGKVNATFVTLARNSDLWDIIDSIRGVEDRFNRNYGYDWVFLNDKPFDEDFKKITTALISGKTHYGTIGKEHWSFPDWIDQGKAQKVREDMAERKIIYGDSVSYRHMCRFESGFFFRQPLLMNYEWYWRVEPSVKIFCDIKYDPFKFMVEHKKKYSFVISLYEYVETIPTIWESAKRFMSEYPQHIAKDNSMKWLSNDDGESYNHCHFWSNFEIGNLNWLRSQAYTDFFDVLDKDGGFFYERWGDAPVHSIAAGLLLNKSEIHFFDDIGYWHVPFTHCPTDEKKRLENKCHCNPTDNFDWKGYSCTTKWFDMNKLPKPEGWKDQTD